jgi:C-terminal processing protease CtpA/Prc
MRVRFNGTGVFYPNARRTQRAGILPDVHVTPPWPGALRGSTKSQKEAKRRIEQ